MQDITFSTIPSYLHNSDLYRTLSVLYENKHEDKNESLRDSLKVIPTLELPKVIKKEKQFFFYLQLYQYWMADEWFDCMIWYCWQHRSNHYLFTKIKTVLHEDNEFIELLTRIFFNRDDESAKKNNIKHRYLIDDLVSKGANHKLILCLEKYNLLPANILQADNLYFLFDDVLHAQVAFFNSRSYEFSGTRFFGHDDTNILNLAICHKNFDLAYHILNNYSLSPEKKCYKNTCRYAAHVGNLDLLKHLHKLGFVLEYVGFYGMRNVCHTAAVSGHLNCLKYGHENQCSMNFHHIRYLFYSKHENSEIAEYIDKFAYF